MGTERYGAILSEALNPTGLKRVYECFSSAVVELEQFCQEKQKKERKVELSSWDHS